MNTSLKLFTDPRLLSQVSHRQVALLIDRLVQLFPGKYVLPATRPDNDPFVEVLAEKLAAPDNDLPAPFLTALKEVEALASPKNVQNLNIPQNVDPQDPESTPLYHAILAWLAKHPAPPVKPPPPAPPTDTASSLPLRDRKLPKKSSAPRKGAPSHPENPAQLTTGSAPPVGTPSPASPIPQHRVSPENAVLLSPNGDHAVPASVGMPSSVSPINQNLPTAETAVPAASDNAYDALDSPGAPAPIEPEPEPDELPARSARPGLKLRLSVLFYEIDPRVRHEFFARFEKELREAFPDLPEISYDNQHFDNAVYGLLKRPAFLPEPMRNALLAIQELAAPANRQLLRALATHRSIYCEHQATPEHVAVGYWLKFPFQPGELESLRASVPSHLLSPPKPRSNGEATDDEGGLPWPETVQERAPQAAHHPGDLAAIARFPRNKIAKLPPEVREEINVMLRLRVTYQEILAHLGPRGAGLNRNNLSRWKKTGYLVWLAEQQRREDAKVQLELLFDLVQEKDNAKLHEATQQIAALRISQVLAAFDINTLTTAFQQHPQSFVRLLQTLPSLGRAGMDCERLLVELAERKATLDPAAKKRRGLPEESMQYITQKINLM